MSRNILAGLVVAAACVIVVSFFLPWARVSVSALGVSEKLIQDAESTLKDAPLAGKVVGKLDKITGVLSSFGDISVKTQVSGYNIPVLVNNKTSKVAISIAQIMFKSAEKLDLKSLLVYLLPLLGILCAVASFLGREKKLYVIAMLAVAGLVSTVGLYNLYTTNIANIMVKVTIMKGLWLTMYGFLFIFFVGITWLATDKKSGKK